MERNDVAESLVAKVREAPAQRGVRRRFAR
jgi:hypothetical protein